MSETLYVIGSGPAGTATAQALLKRGYKVVMLDSGYQLEEDKRQLVDRMSQRQPSQWDNRDTAILKGDFQIDAEGATEKQVYGSGYANRQSRFCPTEIHNARFYQSYARGGLSNLWGRGILPLSAEDAADWPVSLDQLEPYYRQVLSYVPVSGDNDDLSEIYPLHTDSPHKIKLSRQSRNLLNRLENNRKKLAAHGVHFGKTRLAANMDDCRYCGLCMYGCPYGLLYSTSQTLDAMLSDSNFTYQGGITVKFLKETETGVSIFGKNEDNGEDCEFTADRVFLAAGSIASTRIMLESLSHHDSAVEMKCSDMFYMPALALKGARNTTSESMFTLTQLMLEIRDDAIGKHFTSLHLHGYNELYSNMLNSMAGALKNILRPFINAFLNRLFVVFVFLHSDYSAKLALTLKKDGTLLVEGRDNSASDDTYKLVRSKMWNISRLTRLFPIPLYRKSRLPGQSMHFGGSFPMSESPEGLQSDIYGRVGKMTKIHVTDAAVFPTVPAGSYTLTIMANAARIASEF